MPLVVVIAVSLRLPFIGRSPGPDEAGFLMVGGQWHAGGTSLYGNYWVDRPPLLVWIFQGISGLGGVTALRLIGCVAVALIVIGTSVAAKLIAGPRAGRWAALTAAAMSTSPLLGTHTVNGELLAAPFIVLGIIATLYALRTPSTRNVRLFALVAGAAAMAPVLIKQNLIDVFVFGFVATLIAWHRRDIDGKRLARILGSATSGALLFLGFMAVVTVLHGTSLRGVFDAMYPFRIQASKVQAAGGSQHSLARLSLLMVDVISSGVLFLALAGAWGIASKRLRGSAGWALVASVIFCLASIAMGGNYWSHYLVELIVPVSIAMGVLVGRRQPFTKPLVAGVALLAVMTSIGTISPATQSSGSIVGHAIAASASPGDTIVTVYGHGDIDQQSGLSSPYENLWSLPTKTRDPQLTGLNTVLSGPQAPTWLVTWSYLTSWGLSTDQVRATVSRDYRIVGKIHGHTIYLHDGMIRPTLSATAKDTTP